LAAARDANGMEESPDRELPRCVASAAREEGREDWLSSIPVTVARFCEDWSLSVGRPFQPGGQTAWVAPVRTAGNADLVLKVAWRHPEAEHEADGLQVWAGNGSVELHASAELADTIVLLMERCLPGTALSEEPETRQDEVIAGLLQRLWVPPPQRHRFRPLAQMCEKWAEEFEAKRSAGRANLEPDLADHGIELFRSLPDSADRQVLLCTDLHAGNVLAAQREPWLMVDPKPYVGDPSYDVLQHLLNCEERLSDDPHALLARLAGLLGLDRERLRSWLFARCVQESPDSPELADVARKLARR
jgi:streptomycin 6-kinase